MGWTFEVTIPARPPSVNDMYGVASGDRRYLKAKGRRWRLLVEQCMDGRCCVGGSPAAKDRFRVYMEVCAPWRQLWGWDVDNCVKIAVDAVCERLGLDDRYMVGVSAVKVPARRVSTKVRVWESPLVPLSRTFDAQP